MFDLAGECEVLYGNDKSQPHSQTHVLRQCQQKLLLSSVTLHIGIIPLMDWYYKVQCRPFTFSLVVCPAPRVNYHLH